MVFFNSSLEYRACNPYYWYPKRILLLLILHFSYLDLRFIVVARKRRVLHVSQNTAFGLSTWTLYVYIDICEVAGILYRLLKKMGKNSPVSCMFPLIRPSNSFNAHCRYLFCLYFHYINLPTQLEPFLPRDWRDTSVWSINDESHLSSLLVSVLFSSHFYHWDLVVNVFKHVPKTCILCFYA